MANLSVIYEVPLINRTMEIVIKHGAGLATYGTLLSRDSPGYQRCYNGIKIALS